MSSFQTDGRSIRARLQKLAITSPARLNAAFGHERNNEPTHRTPNGRVIVWNWAATSRGRQFQEGEPVCAHRQSQSQRSQSQRSQNVVYFFNTLCPQVSLELVESVFYTVPPPLWSVVCVRLRCGCRWFILNLNHCCQRDIVYGTWHATASAARPLRAATARSTSSSVDSSRRLQPVSRRRRCPRRSTRAALTAVVAAPRRPHSYHPPHRPHRSPRRSWRRRWRRRHYCYSARHPAPA